MRIVREVLEKQFDTYIKKTIKNTIINYKKYEIKKMHREVSFETLSNDADISVPFSFSLKENLEDYFEVAASFLILNYFENEKLYTVVSKLTAEQKEILELKILYNYNSKEIAQQLNKSDSRVRHIYADTIKKINNQMKE